MLFLSKNISWVVKKSPRCSLETILKLVLFLIITPSFPFTLRSKITFCSTLDSKISLMECYATHFWARACEGSNKGSKCNSIRRRRVKAVLWEQIKKLSMGIFFKMISRSERKITSSFENLQVILSDIILLIGNYSV